MANIEKAKLEKAEMEALSKDIMKELEAMNSAAPAPAPEKPKVKRTRKPKTTPAPAPAPVEVKIHPDPDPSEALTEPETDPEMEEKGEPYTSASNPVSTASTPVYAEFDQDAFANKVVNMLVQKGIGAMAPPVPGKPKTLKPRKPTVKKSSSETITPPPPTRIPKEAFVWM